MGDNGWIRLHRKLRDNWLWQERRTFSRAEAWIDLLLRSCHEKKKLFFRNELHNLQRGQLVTTLSDLASNWKWDKSKTRRFIQLLAEDGMIEHDTTRNATIITILNYDNYQVVAPKTSRKVKSIEDQKADLVKQMEPFHEKYPRPMMLDFYYYWAEHGPKDKKIRKEKEKSFDVERRLRTWYEKSLRDGKNPSGRNTSDNIPLAT